MKVSVATLDEIYQCRDSWNALVDQMRHPVIFLTWEWLVSWLESSSEGYQPLILFVRDAHDELVAILPLARVRKRLEGMPLPVDAVTLCSSLECYPDHLDLISPGNADAFLALDACFDYLKRHRLAGGVFYFPFLAEEGFLASYLAAQRLRHLRVERVNTLVSPYVDLTGGYDSYVGAMSKKKRYNLSRERKILCEEHKAEFLRMNSAESLATAIDTLFDLHAKRAQDKGLSSNFTGPSTIKFHQLLGTRLVESGRVRLYLLKIGQEVIATVYGFLLHREFAFYQTGLDPAWKKYSPGKVMISIVLEDLAAQGVSLFDFLGGGDEYKQFWATGSRKMDSFIVFNKTTAGVANFLSFQAKRGAKRAWSYTALIRKALLK